MKRLLATVVLLSTTGTLAAACSSSSGNDQALCARLSACVGAVAGKMGTLCETVSLFADIDTSLLGSEDRIELATFDCVKNASDCTEAQACLTPTSDQAMVCKGQNNGFHCSGDVAVECGAGAAGRAEDCGAAGLHCFETASGASCGTDKCDPATTKDSCDGDFRVRCADGGLQRESCRLTQEVDCSIDNMGNSTCATHVANTCAMVNGEAKCVGDGDACDDATFKPKCDGTTLVTCTGGKTARVDCTGLDSHLTCKDKGSGQVSCEGAGTECDEDTAETCKDGVVTYCLFGTKTTLDCKSFGYSGCTSGSKVAACTP